MSRSPIEGFPHSNGHGRRQQGNAPVARQSNLIVMVDHPVSRAELKRRLIEEVKKQNQKFGLFFDDIQGGFTLTSRFTPNAFNVLPIMVYRIYPDGREELVRGVNLIGTPLTAFSKIVAGDARGCHVQWSLRRGIRLGSRVGVFSRSAGFANRSGRKRRNPRRGRPFFPRR